MTRRSIGYAALVAAAGWMMLTATPTRAAPAAESKTAGEPISTGKPLALTEAKKPRVPKASRAKAAKATARKAGRKIAKATTPAPAAMPDDVANAQAQMPSSDAQGAASVTPLLEAAAAEQMDVLGKALAAPADEAQQLAQLVAPDQPQSTLLLSAPEPNRPLKQARVTASSNDGRNDPWAQSSLIGKIFIAFGGVLTLASAARMLVA